MDNNNENVERYVNPVELDQENKGVKTKKAEDTIYWDDALEETFVLLMEEEVRQENRISTTFNSIGWRHLVDGMIEKTGKIFTEEQLRNKFNGMRGVYKDFKKLLSETGVGYNRDTGMIVVEDERWERLYKVVTGAKKFQRKGYKHYDKLTTIFRDTYTSGSQVHLSTRAPTTFQLPTHHAATHSIDLGEGEEIDTSPSPQPTSKKLKKDNFASTMSPVMVTMIASMAENANMRAERNEIAIAASVTASSSTNLASPKFEEQEVVSLSNNERVREKGKLCIRALNALEGIDDIHYFKALQLLHDDELWRHLFLQIPDERRVGWVMNL